MPIYSYECSFCKRQFDEFHNVSEGNCGKSNCYNCGNIAFKIPAVFNTNIFKKREFADGTSTPDHVRTPKQEKDWLKSQGITYDAPSSQVKWHNELEKKKKSETAMEIAFKDAYDKTKQGYKIENPKQKEVKKNALRW
jgi:putative FmdB family regulatory protein